MSNTTEVLQRYPPAPQRQVLTVILIVLAVVIVAALGGALYAVNKAASNDRQQLEQQITSLRKQATDDSGLITTLQSQINGLTSPSDPLSAYSDICHQEMTNTSSGITQPYYFPCTNNATTIPQPGT